MKMPELSAIGILGGTFDPVHNAHLALARLALAKLGLAQVLWIPAGQPPHRSAPLAAPVDRLAMVAAAIAGEPRFVLDASEVASTAASYTVHTLKRLRQTFGASRPLVLLMGADAFRGLPGWHRWQEIFDLAHIAVATRPGFPLDSVDGPLAAEYSSRRPAITDFSSPAGRIVTFELIAGTVSATEVRGLVAAGASTEKLTELLPPPVLDYIHQHSLYRN
jgi:nicotinate-nucleotide adenylyltransferase